MSEQTEINAEMTEEQAAFIASLEEQEAVAEFDPEEVEQLERESAQAAEMAELTSTMTAIAGLESIEFVLRRVIHKEFKFSKEVKADAVENLKPVLIKYGALLPEWFSRYEAEFSAAKAVFTLASEGMDTAKSLKARDAAEKAAQAAAKAAEEQQALEQALGEKSDSEIH